MKRFVLLSLLLVSCGSTPNGLEIQRFGQNVSLDGILFTLDTVEEQFLETYEQFANFDLNTLIDSRGLRIEFPVERPENASVDAAGDYHKGKHVIRVFDFDEENAVSSCHRPFRILAHEVLHFITEEYVRGSEESNGWDGRPHFYPGMYNKWAKSLGLSIDITLEYRINKLIICYCAGDDYVFECYF